MIHPRPRWLEGCLCLASDRASERSPTQPPRMLVLQEHVLRKCLARAPVLRFPFDCSYSSQDYGTVLFLFETQRDVKLAELQKHAARKRVLLFAMQRLDGSVAIFSLVAFAPRVPD